MKYSIFHTSHCGSTLLACLLSESIPTLTEPDWVYKALDINNMEEQTKFINDHHEEKVLVKYTSLICNVMPNVNGKKVFLYNNFEDHLRKLAGKPNFNIQTEAVFWSQRFLFATISQDVLYLQTEYFLNNKEEALNRVCNHFGIDYKPTKNIDFHVKQAGFNHRNEPIKL
jgi:hypothetical protein